MIPYIAKIIISSWHVALELLQDFSKNKIELSFILKNNVAVSLIFLFTGYSRIRPWFNLKESSRAL